MNFSIKYNNMCAINKQKFNCVRYKTHGNFFFLLHIETF